MSIKRIDIVHHNHTDIGYTDHPATAREILADFVGEAVDLVLETRDSKAPFAWTCEALLAVSDWLDQADEQQKADFYEAVKTGKLDITAIPFNVTPFHSEQEWDQLMDWMPQSFWDRVPIRTAMQNDINGFSVAAAEKLMDKGVRYLWMGPNIHLAAPPFKTPHAFRWKLPSGRTMLVWLSGHYNGGFYLFNEFWREGPIPNSHDTCYRRPDAQDIFLTDDASMKKAHEQCLKCMAAFEGREPNAGQFVRDGFTFNKIDRVYDYETLVVSITNHWRMDNDPPIAHLNRFVERWNELGYTPELRMVTATEAMEDIEREAGATADVVEGEWPDWWANGTMSVPRELSYAREALRTYNQAVSPLFGQMQKRDQKKAERIMKDLCLFNEHTYGGWQSISNPNSFEAISGIAEVNLHAYHALEDARSLLSDRFRRAFSDVENEICIANTDNHDFSGWITIPLNCLRGEYKAVKNKETGEISVLEQYNGGGAYARPTSMAELTDEHESTDYADNIAGYDVRFWVNRLPANTVSHFEACTEYDAVPDVQMMLKGIRVNADGWPETICYNDFEESMIQPGFADFIGVTEEVLAPRWSMIDMFDETDPVKREQLRSALVQKNATYGKTLRTESEHDIRFEQPMYYNSLDWAKRILVVNKHEAKAKLAIHMRRKDNPQPELYYLQLNVSDTKELPTVSLVNHEFVPGRDQIPNTCMDYHTCDGWIRYEKAGTSWSVYSEDAPMLTFGKPNCFARIQQMDEHMEKPLFMLFDNTWDTNFVCNESGRFVYQFDILQTKNPADKCTDAVAMATKPAVLVKMRNQK